MSRCLCIPMVAMAAIFVGCSEQHQAAPVNAVGAGSANALNDNWLSKSIAEVRKDTHRILPRRERQAEIDQVFAQIKKHPRGDRFQTKGDQALRSAINKGLDAAAAREEELRKNPRLMTSSPAQQAAMEI